MDGSGRTENTGKGRHIDRLLLSLIPPDCHASDSIFVFRATRWDREQAIDFGEPEKNPTESIRATRKANSLLITDVQLFTGWVDAMRRRDNAQAQYMEVRGSST